MEEGFVEEFHLVDSSSFFCCVWKGGKGKERERKGREGKGANLAEKDRGAGGGRRKRKTPQCKRASSGQTERGRGRLTVHRRKSTREEIRERSCPPPPSYNIKNRNLQSSLSSSSLNPAISMSLPPNLARPHPGEDSPIS